MRHKPKNSTNRERLAKISTTKSMKSKTTREKIIQNWINSTFVYVEFTYSNFDQPSFFVGKLQW